MQHVAVDMFGVPEHDPAVDKITVQFKRFTSPPSWWDNAQKKWTTEAGPPIELLPNPAGKAPLWYDAWVATPQVVETIAAVFTHSRFGTFSALDQKTKTSLVPRAVMVSY